jgi:arsenate reductase-like glutaredoxin family protein
MTNLLIIKTEQSSSKIKALLDEKHINYQIIADETNLNKDLLRKVLANYSLTIQGQNLTEEEI